MTRVRLIVALLLALVAAGCGPLPPQAPLHYARKLDASTSGISTACGYAYRVTDFPGDHRRDLQRLETQASTSARKLAAVYRANPDWVYQGETVRQIVGAGTAMLDSCGLHRARAVLMRLTAGG